LNTQNQYRFNANLPGNVAGNTEYGHLFASFMASYTEFGTKTNSTLGSGGNFGGNFDDSLKVNGSQSITVKPGDLVSYTWNATDPNATASNFSVDSYYTADVADSCAGGISTAGVTKPWVANVPAGARSFIIGECQAGVTYTVTFRINHSTGVQVIKTVVVKVSGTNQNGGQTPPTNPGQVPPVIPPVVLTDSLSVNDKQSVVVNVGDALSFKWTSIDGNGYDSYYSANKADTCLGGYSTSDIGNTKPWVAFTASGYNIQTAKQCQAGVTYTIYYRIYKNNATQVIKNITVTVNGSGTTGTTDPSSAVNHSSGSIPQADRMQQRIINSTNDVINSYLDQFRRTSGLDSSGAPAQDSSTVAGSCPQLTSNLRQGDSGDAVTLLSKVLVSDGELTSEQSAFNTTMFDAVVAYQEKYADQILTPSGLDKGTGFVGPSTRAYMNKTVLSCPK